MLTAARLSLVVLVSSFFSYTAAQDVGLAKCADGGLDWYIGKIGETPCRTYQRLRQICNSNYELGALSVSTPPDLCSEQVADCCCNNIAFSLSMLCLTCQKGLGTGGDGFDAGKGAYQVYLNGGRANNALCSPRREKSLPTNIQSAVCNNDIKIYDDLYNIYWDTGDWFYQFTSQTITKNQASSPDKVITKCDKPSTTTASNGPTGTADQSNGNSNTSSGRLSGGAIGGIVAGVVIALLAGAIVAFFFFRRKKRGYVGTSGVNIDGDGDETTQVHSGPAPPAPVPFLYSPPASTSHGAPSVVTSPGYQQPSTPGYFPSAPSQSGASSSYEMPNPHPGSTQGSSSYGGGSSAGFVVSNPSGDATTSEGTSSAAAFSNRVSKGAAPNAGMNYVPVPPPTSSSRWDDEDRHVDAGPVGGSSLQRNASGRLPPAYGDLVR